MPTMVCMYVCMHVENDVYARCDMPVYMYVCMMYVDNTLYASRDIRGMYVCMNVWYVCMHECVHGRQARRRVADNNES
jgi:hypothetical protein